METLVLLEKKIYKEGRGEKMNYNNFKWLAESRFKEIDNGIELFAPANSDYFVNPIDGQVTATAPFLYQEVSGDFVFKANVHHAFVSTYDACVLLALDHESLWAKACFEYSDLGMHAIVSVMTNQKSDDANGVAIESDTVWLQLSRKGDIFAVHYSLDGHVYKMARLTYLPMKKTIKVGFEAQSPMGEGGMRYFTNCSLELKTLEDIRDGNH